MYNSIIVFRINSIFRNDWRSTSQISYDRLITEDGNSTLDKNTGLWTAGVSGVYQVSWSLENSPDRGENNMIYLFR